MGGFLGLDFGGGKKKSSGEATETITPWDESAVYGLGGLGDQSADLANLLGSQLTGWELPYQQALYGANASMLPYQTGAGMLSQEEIMRDILAGRDVKDTMRDSYMSEMEASSPMTAKFYKDAMKGFDPTTEANQAEANVVRSMNKAREAYGQNLGSYGINPNKMAGQERAFDIATAENVVGAREAAADQAKRDSFDRLLGAMGVKDNAYKSLLGIGAVSQGSGQGQFDTNSSLDSILNAINTGGGIYNKLLAPKSTYTKQKGTVRNSSWNVGAGFQD